MAHRELELTLLSARDLKNVNLFTRMDVYAVASISGDPMTRQCTPTDTSGGRNPSWGATLRFNVPPSAAEAGTGYIHVLLRSERALGDKDIGEVVVPLADLLAGADQGAGTGAQPARTAAFQVHTVHRGEARGVLNMAYRFGPVVAPVNDKQKPVAVGFPAPQQQPFQPQNPAAPYPYHQNQPPPYYGHQQPFKNHTSAPPPHPFDPQSPAPQKPYENHHSQGAYGSPRQQPFKHQTPATPSQQPPSKPQTPAAPHQYPRREPAPSPANGNGKGHGTPMPQFIVCPDIRVTVANTTPPATPRSNSTSHTIPAKPKPSYTPPAHQHNTSPVKTDHSWTKPTPQHQNTPTWPNANPNKPIQQDTTKVGSGRIADHSAAAAALKQQDSTRIGGSNIGGRAESRPREGYANSSMPGGKAHPHQSSGQYERVPSMPTAAAR